MEHTIREFCLRLFFGSKLVPAVYKKAFPYEPNQPTRTFQASLLAFRQAVAETPRASRCLAVEPLKSSNPPLEAYVADSQEDFPQSSGNEQINVDYLPESS